MLQERDTGEWSGKIAAETLRMDFVSAPTGLISECSKCME